MSAVMTARTGAFAYAKYGWESTFRGGATAYDKVFGRGVRITGLSVSHNAELIPELGVREYQGWVFKQFEGSVSVDWIYSNPWFFRAVMGQVTTSGTGPYTHSYTKTKLPPSFAIEIGSQLSGGNVVRFLKGCVVNTLTLTASVGEVIRVSADILYAEESLGSTLSTPIVDTFEPASFAHATLELPNGTVLGEVQTFDLTIGNNALRVFGLGDIYATSAVWQNFDATGRLSVTFKNATFLNYLRTAVANGKLKIQLSTDNSLTINFADLVFGEHTQSFEPNALLLEDVPILIRNITSIDAVNNVAIHP